MRFYVLFFCSMISIVNADESVRIINNTDQPLHVDYGLPIYSRADTQIKPIKSQQELQDLLHEAILTNSTQEIMQVVNAGADVNIFKDGKAPLMWATLLKKLNSIEVLKKCGAIIPCPKNMLYRAILNDSPEEIRQAIQAGANVREVIKDNKFPLIWAVLLGRHKAIEALLENDVKKLDVPYPYHADCARFNYLEQALLLGDIKSALILVKMGADFSEVNVCGMDVLQYTIGKIDPMGIEEIILEFIQELINRGYNINSNAYSDAVITQRASAWVSAINSPFCSIKGLELFMKNGANPNQIIYQNPYGLSWTPLLLAIQKNDLNVVRFLLGAGADINQKAVPVQTHRSRTPADYQTPLGYARSLNNQEIINLLIKHGARQ